VSFDIRFSIEAEESIDHQLHGYKAQLDEGHQLARRWYHKLGEALEALRDRPERFGFAPENGRWSPELELYQLKFRPWKTGSTWRVLFVIEAKKETVTVIQIRHASRRRLYEPKEFVRA